MHHFRTTRRIVLGAALAAAAIGAVPAMASAATTCTYQPKTKDVNVTDGSGVAKLRVVRSGERIMVSDGFGPLQACLGEAVDGSDQVVLATVANTSRIQLYGPVATTGDGYIIDQSGGVFSPKPSGRPTIPVTAYTDWGFPASLRVIGTPAQDTIKVAYNGVIDVDRDGLTDIGVTAGATSVTLDGGANQDLLGGDGFGSLGQTWVPLWLNGGDNADQLIGGSNDDHLDGGAGADVFHAIGFGEDHITGGPDFDTANLDHFDTPTDFIELKHYGF